MVAAVVVPGVRTPREQVLAGAAEQVEACVGAMNLAVVGVVRAIQSFVAHDLVGETGARSVTHWVTVFAGVSPRRAERLVRIARRVDELPACWAHFEAGRLTEDAMGLIAERVPAHRDAEVAELAPAMLYTQLARFLRSMPEQREQERHELRQPRMQVCQRDDGWVTGSFCLPPDDGAQLQHGLTLAREAEHRDRLGADETARERPGTARERAAAAAVTWVDALNRLVSEAVRGLDTEAARTGAPGERTKLVLHAHLLPDGTLTPAQVALGPRLSQHLSRFLVCDSDVQAVLHREGRLVGILPSQRTVSRALRRAIEHRDQGCVHPLCTQRRWLHVHHIVHWADGGLTTPSNLVCLCPRHHRALHRGELSIHGSPERGTLEVRDARGSPIRAPDRAPPAGDPPTGPGPFTHPSGERLHLHLVTWR